MSLIIHHVSYICKCFIFFKHCELYLPVEIVFLKVCPMFVYFCLLTLGNIGEQVPYTAHKCLWIFSSPRTNRFKGLDLIDTVPEELWMEVCDIELEAGIKIIPKGKKCKKAKWFSEEALQIAVNRRERRERQRREGRTSPSECRAPKTSKER